MATLDLKKIVSRRWKKFMGHENLEKEMRRRKQAPSYASPKL